MKTIQDSIERAQAARFFGRDREIARLNALFEPDGPIVTLLHGVGGIGKTSLVRAFERESAACGREVRRLDCRTFEPVPHGLLGALGGVLHCELTSVRDAAAAIQARESPVVFALDNYDALRLLDGWLRTELLPALPLTARFLIVGRSLATAHWISAPGWAEHVSSLRLGPLSDSEVSAFLLDRGFPESARHTIARLSKGNPLALQLCTARAAERADGLRADLEFSDVIDHLALACVSEIEDPELKRAIEAASLVRRVTTPILEALLPEHDAGKIIESFRRLSFVDHASDGLIFHDSFRLAIESRLAAMDPDRTRKLKLAAWKCVRDQLRSAAKGDTWRHTADLLFLLERPVIREAFFPSGATMPVERAMTRDRDPILLIAREHDGEASAAVLSNWWKLAQSTFSVVRGNAGEVIAFYILTRDCDIPDSLIESDPVIKAWMNCIRDQKAGPHRPFLLIRSLLARTSGERQSPEWATCVLDAKRAYLENPEATAVFTAIREPAVLPLGVIDLGFCLLPNLTVFVGDTAVYTAALNFGSKGPVDWMLDFVGKDLTQDKADLRRVEVKLDVSRREVVVRDRDRFGLTKLEFELMLYMSQRPGAVLTRDELLREVWKQPFGGSNVVDAVVRSIRKKLGKSAWVIETAKGHGYRYVEDHTNHIN